MNLVEALQQAAGAAGCRQIHAVIGAPARRDEMAAAAQQIREQGHGSCIVHTDQQAEGDHYQLLCAREDGTYTDSIDVWWRGDLTAAELEVHRRLRADGMRSEAAAQTSRILTERAPVREHLGESTPHPQARTIQHTRGEGR